MRLTDLQKKLIDKNVIELAGTVDGEMVDYVRQSSIEFISKGSPEIIVFITSNGGDVNAGLIIYDMLACYPNKVTGIVIGSAKSMGAVILQACTFRYATQHSHILIHHITRNSLSLDTMRDARKFKEVRRSAEKNQSRLYKILAERTGRSVAEIRKVCKIDEDMTVEESLAFGLIDGVHKTRAEGEKIKKTVKTETEEAVTENVTVIKQNCTQSQPSVAGERQRKK